MRYDNWDIILFPDDSNIPIAEYKTACYFSRDEADRELPTLRTYISSLKPETPFRISVHHWGPPQHSPLLQHVQRRAGSDITFTVQVFIDGVRLYHGNFGVNTNSPHEIAYEQRSFRPSHSRDQPTSQPRQRLLFPTNDKNALLQSSAWQPRGTDNRIKITLSERLINKDLLGDDCWDIVCFSFHHAPRELLEQAGIAYPLSDPLRSLMGQRATTALRPAVRKATADEMQRRSHVQADSTESDVEPTKPVNPEPHQQPPTRMASIASYPPQFMGHRGGGIPGIWPDYYGPSTGDEASMGQWPTQRYTSSITGLEGVYNPSFPTYTLPIWPHGTAAPEQYTASYLDGTRRRNDRSSQQVMMALRDDQVGQILEANSPSKKQRNKPSILATQQRRAHDTDTVMHRPPKIGALSVPVRPTLTAIASSTTTLDRNAGPRASTRRPSSDQASSSTRSLFKANMYHTKKKEDQGTSVSMHNPFVREKQRRDSDVSMRDGSSKFPTLSTFEADPTSLGIRFGSAHAPSGGAAIKSRKEGFATSPSDDVGTDIRNEQSLLPRANAELIARAQRPVDDTEKPPKHKSTARDPSVADHVEVIDVDAIDPNLVAEATADMAKLSPFKPAHKAGMSSISSTGRLERQLYSALGEELGSFEQQLDTVDMGPELAQALSGMETHSDLSASNEVETPIDEPEPMVKRKRQGTLGGARDPSPTKKKEKGRKATVEDVDIPEHMPRLRGD